MSPNPNGLDLPTIMIDRADQARTTTDKSPQTPIHLPADGLIANMNAPPKEELLGGAITLKIEPGKAPKLSRAASQKIVSRPKPLYHHLPDATADAKSTFDLLPECTYANKHIGTTEHALECDCSEEWGKPPSPSPPSPSPPDATPANEPARSQPADQQCLRP